MSRSYNMLVRVRDVTPERVDRVKQAANEEWDFDDWHEHENSISSCIDGYLCGGETEDEFVERLTKAIWTANGSFCEVEVNATYLDQMPYETHCLDEDDYDQFLSAADKSAETQEDRNNE
jgi:hypothetical protein